MIPKLYGATRRGPARTPDASLSSVGSRHGHDVVAAIFGVRLLVVYVPTISRPHDPANASWRGRTGRVEHVVSDVWRQLRLTPDGSVAYVCGATGMIGAVKEHLRERGLAPGDIHEERYWAAGPRGPGPTT